MLCIRFTHIVASRIGPDKITLAFFRVNDLEQSCVRDENNELKNCQCNDAQRRVDLGQISCDYSSKCPDDCEVCKFCLYYVVDCHSHSPSGSPTSIPSNMLSLEPSLSQSETPSVAKTARPSDLVTNSPPSLPTLFPSAYPTIVGSPSPTDTFNITDCASFSSIW